MSFIRGLPMGGGGMSDPYTPSSGVFQITGRLYVVPPTNTTTSGMNYGGLFVTSFTPASGSGSFAGVEVRNTTNGTSSGTSVGLAVGAITNTLTGGTVRIVDFGTTTSTYASGFTSKLYVSTTKVVATSIFEVNTPADSTTSGMNYSSSISSSYTPGSGTGSFAGLQLLTTVNGTSSGKTASLAVMGITNTLTGGTVNLLDVGTTTSTYASGYTQIFAVKTTGVNITAPAITNTATALVVANTVTTSITSASGTPVNVGTMFFNTTDGAAGSTSGTATGFWIVNKTNTFTSGTQYLLRVGSTSSTANSGYTDALTIQPATNSATLYHTSTFWLDTSRGNTIIMRSGGDGCFSFNYGTFALNSVINASINTKYIRQDVGAGTTAGIIIGQGLPYTGTFGTDTFNPSTAVDKFGLKVISNFTPTASSPNFAAVQINPTINGTSSGTSTALAIATKTNTLTGGTQYLMRVGTTSDDYFTGFSDVMSLTTTGNFSASPNTVTTHLLGTTAVFALSTTQYGYIAHYDNRASGTNYAMAFDNANTWINAVTSLFFRLGASTKITLSTTQFTFVTGYTIIVSGVTSISTEALQLSGNRDATSAFTDVVLKSTATRTNGYLVEIKNNTTSKWAMDYTGLIVRLETDTGFSFQGNRSGGSSTSEFTINSTATRTAGNLFDVQNNITSKFTVNYAGTFTYSGTMTIQYADASTMTTSVGGGAADALPLLPLGYLMITVGGAPCLVPYYDRSDV